jgi:flagellar hook-basal body complex protein FliE
MTAPLALSRRSTLTPNMASAVPLHLHPLDFPLNDLSALNSFELTLVQYHPDSTEELVWNASKLWSRRREKFRSSTPVPHSDPTKTLQKINNLVDLCQIPLDFELDSTTLNGLTSEQLSVVQFHPEGTIRLEMAAEKLFMKRRVRDLEGKPRQMLQLEENITNDVIPVVSRKVESEKSVEKMEEGEKEIVRDDVTMADAEGSQSVAALIAVGNSRNTTPPSV